MTGRYLMGAFVLSVFSTFHNSAAGFREKEITATVPFDIFLIITQVPDWLAFSF